jgi:hypothetical protein
MEGTSAAQPLIILPTVYAAPQGPSPARGKKMFAVVNVVGDTGDCLFPRRHPTGKTNETRLGAETVEFGILVHINFRAPVVE